MPTQNTVYNSIGLSTQQRFKNQRRVASRSYNVELAFSAREKEQRVRKQIQNERYHRNGEYAPRLRDKRCEHEEHENPKCVCNTTNSERAELLRDYLQVLEQHGWDSPQLIPVGSEGKAPYIAERHIGLTQPKIYDLLYNSQEAIKAVKTGAIGFCLYADRPEHNTEGLVFLDRDEPQQWPDLGDTVRVVSGSGTGDHLTFAADGEIENAKGKGELSGIGSVRGPNWFVVLPGSVHPTGGIYHMDENPDMADLLPDQLPRELQKGALPQSELPDGVVSGATSNLNPNDSLPPGFSANDVKNDIGISLQDVRQVSTWLNYLLTFIEPKGYDSLSEADQATVRYLLIWRFEPTDIARILRDCRDRRSRVDPEDHPHKLWRDGYVERTITNTGIPYQVDPDLGKALIEDAKQRKGRRPSVGSKSLREVRDAFQNLGTELTTTEIAKSSYVGRRGSKKSSVKRRVRRCIDIFESAGYITSQRDGRKIIYSEEGLTNLRIPGDAEWCQRTTVLMDEEIDPADMGIESDRDERTAKRSNS